MQSGLHLPFARRTGGLCFLLFVGGGLLWGAVGLPAQSTGAAATPIRTVGDFWQVEEPARQVAHPVDLECTVLYHDPIWNLFWGTTAAGGFFLPTVAGEPPAVRSGQRVRLTGSVVPARGFSGREVQATVLAEEAWPVPRALPEDGVPGPEYDAGWVEVEGYVFRQLESDATHAQYYLLAGGRRISLRLLLGATEPIPQLLDARVRVRGVHVGTRDQAGRLLRTDVWVPRRQDVTVIGSLGDDERFRLPRVTIDQLPASVDQPWVRVVGDVRAWQEGEMLTIRDHTGQLAFATMQPGKFAPGTDVEVVGRPQVVNGTVTLRSPVVRLAQTMPLRSLTRPGGAAVGLPVKLRVAAQVLELEPVEAAFGRPVDLRGVVTWAHPAADFFYLQDASGGIRVQSAALSAQPVVGATLRVEGKTAMGGYAPEMRAVSVAMSSPVNRPAARLITLEQALTGAEEAQWVSLRGYVRAVTAEANWLRLDLSTAAGEFRALVPVSPRAERLVGAVVRVTGVCSAEADAQRQLTGIRLWVLEADQVDVDTPPPVDPFGAPLRSVVGLRQFNAFQSVNQRVRVRGTVVAQEPGRFLCLQDGEAGVVVLGQDTAPVEVGTAVEVVGFPGREGGRVVLREGLVRAVDAPGAAPAPRFLAQPAELAPEADARLVRLRARLIARQERSDGGRLTLQAGARFFEALLPGAAALEPDSEVELTGVYLVEFDEYRRPRGFMLRLRSPADVTVLATPPWWTLRRLVGVVIGLGCCVGLGVVWVVALRRRVRQQTAQIRGQAAREVSLQAELEKSSRLESLGVLAGGIAHDFNNLLTAIVGNLGLVAMDSRVMAAVGAEVQNAQRAARRAGDITQQLLTFAKGGNPVRRAVALPDLVRESAAFVLHGAKVRAEFDFAPELPAAEVDAAQLSRVVHNLVLNAVQAMAGGGVVRLGLRAVTLRAGELEPLGPGRYLELAVADTGPGIPPETLARLFEPYFSTKRGNSGLGLATVRSIVAKHDGHVAVASQAGVGTTFRIWLPVAAGAAEPTAAAGGPRARSRSLRVLLMDDEQIIRDLGARALAHGGHEPVAVEDGAAAIRAYVDAQAGGRPFDVVILDLTVPGGMGGEEAVRELRRLDAGVRVIVSSGYSSNPVMARYREYGFCAVVPKPYEIETLLSAVEAAARA